MFITQNSTALIFYSRQELLDIDNYNTDNFIADLRLIPEISRTLEVLADGAKIENKGEASVEGYELGSVGSNSVIFSVTE